MQIGDSIYINDRDGYKIDIREAYGPYDSIDTANTKVISFLNTLGISSIPIGFTVGVVSSNVIQEYWYNNGSWQIKGGSSSSGKGYNIFTINGVVQDTNTFLNSTFSTAVVGDHIVDTANGGVYIMYETGKWVKLNGTILTDTTPTISRIVNANVLSYK